MLLTALGETDDKIRSLGTAPTILSFYIGSNMIDVHINFLRRKLDNGSEPKLIHTLAGVGYVLEVGM